jgi:hypothetical protein
VLIAFYLGMSLALTATYYARIWDEAGNDEKKQKSAIRKAIFFPYFLLAMPVIALPGVKKRLKAYHDVIFDEESEPLKPLKEGELQKLYEEERPKMLAETRKEETKDGLEEGTDSSHR